MNNLDLLSIIVPVYNAECYLERCLNSILNQTYKNLEIILIDDGSTDNSPFICDKYASLDNRIKVIHQNNEGQGNARRKGIKLSKGNYIAFVDNDDYIRPNMYETMIDLIKKNKVDICVCLWNYETDDGYQSVNAKTYSSRATILGQHNSLDFAHYIYSETPYEYGIVTAPWNKVFKKEILQDIYFSGKRGEEEEMIDSILSKNIKIFVDKHDFYIWCHHASSMSHSNFTPDWLHILDVLHKRIQLYKSDNYMTFQTKLRYCNLCIEFYYEMVKLGCKFPHKYIHQLKQINYNLFMNKKYKPGFKFHLRMLIFLTSPFLYKRIILRK